MSEAITWGEGKVSKDAPLVSVLVVTCNHEQYIAEALSSVLMQECDFQYEIVVADDCSSDGTPAIVQSFAEKDPHLFRVLHSPHRHGVTRNYQRAFGACRGEYIAVLEGDDYWTSPHKLSRQVRFLHEHRECPLCFNRFVYYYENSGRFTLHPAFEVDTPYKLISSEELVKDNFIGNLSACVYRKSVVAMLEESLYAMKVYDWMFNIVLSQYGLIGYLPEVMSAYRKHASGTFAGLSVEEQEQEMLELIDIYNDYLDRKFEIEFMYMKNRIIETIDSRTKYLAADPQDPVRRSAGHDGKTNIYDLLLSRERDLVSCRNSVTGLRKELAERDDTINGLRKELAEKDNTINGLREKLAESESILTGLRKKYIECEARWSALEQCRSWKILRIFTNVRRR